MMRYWVSSVVNSHKYGDPHAALQAVKVFTMCHIVMQGECILEPVLFKRYVG